MSRSAESCVNKVLSISARRSRIAAFAHLLLTQVYKCPNDVNAYPHGIVAAKHIRGHQRAVLVEHPWQGVRAAMLLRTGHKL